MKRPQKYPGTPDIHQGLQMALAILISMAMAGCYSRSKAYDNQMQMQETTNSNTEKLISQIKQLQENQERITEDVESIKMDQLTIGTKVTGTQRQLTSQVLITTQTIQREQADLRSLVETANTQFHGQFQTLASQQQDMKKDIATLHAQGQPRDTRHDQVLAQLAELKQGFQYWQGQLDSLQERITGLKNDVLAVQGNLDEFKTDLTGDLRTLAQDQTTRRASEQEIGEHLTALKCMLTDVEILHGQLVAMLQGDDRRQRVPDSAPIPIIDIDKQEIGQVSLSNQIDAPTKPGIDAFKGSR